MGLLFGRSRRGRERDPARPAPFRGGMPDLSFDPRAGANDRIRCLLPLPDGRLLVGGDFTAFDGQPRHHVVRLHADGSVDGSFVPQAGAVGTVFAMVAQPGGQVLAAGWGALGAPSIARLNADGSPDPGFTLSSEFFGYFYALVVQPDGRILVGGSYTGIDGVRLRRVARLLPDGRVDDTFDPGEGFSNGHPEREAAVKAMVVQADGKILIGGDFSHFHGTPRRHLVRLHPDGTLDGSFDPGAGPSAPVPALALRPDGRILAGGAFTQVDGRPCSCLLQLDPDGRPDPGFDPGRTFTGGVTCLVLAPDGGLFASGAHHSSYGEVSDRIVRLDGRGRRDTAFRPVDDLDGQVRGMALCADGSLVFAGDITRACGLPCRGIGRLGGGG